jgi:hypothetical protein
MKVYVYKENTAEFVVVPAPRDEELGEFYVVEMDEAEIDSIPATHRYNPETGKFQECPELCDKYAIKRRARAYVDESDHLFKEWQFDVMSGNENADETKQKWIDKVNEIKARHPKSGDKKSD